jgi:hypothetical protein
MYCGKVCIIDSRLSSHPMQLWAVFEQYEASGKRDDNYKFEASEYFHHVYDSVAEALEQFDQLPMSGELFREH